MSDQDNKPWEWGDKGVPQNHINHYPEGTRFLCCGYDGHMNQFSQGNWVRHEDYAKLQMERIHDLNQMGELKAENARLKAEVERLTKQNALATPRHLIASQDITSLREQVERLTKAGDELERVLTSKMSSYEVGNASFQWRAAKEGKHP